MPQELEMQETVVEGVTKYTIAFPLTDDTGQPITDRQGKQRFTNLIADSPSELVRKIAESNLEVTRALDRANKHIDTLKNKKPTPAQPVRKFESKPLTAEEQVQVGLDAQDPRKAAAAIQRVVESVVPVAQITDAVKQTAQNQDTESRLRVAREFFGRHPEYNNSANGTILGKWVYEGGYDFTVDNLEIAFAANEDRLARNAPPNNARPDNAAPGNEPPNPGASPSPTRRVPVSGISNSQASGRPLAASQLPYTRDQLLAMAYKHDPRYTELIQDPVKNKMVNAILAGR